MRFYIEGDLIVQIPVVGESISIFKTSESAEFYMDYIEGVSITKEGRLIINTDVNQQNIKIYARNYTGEVAEAEIQLLKSWTENFVEKDGTVMKIPREGEMPVLAGTLYNFAVKETTIWCIRGASVLICIAFISLYYSWKKRQRGK